MKLIRKLVVAASVIAVCGAATAQSTDGPPLSQLKALDTSRYDQKSLKAVEGAERANIWHWFSKRTFTRKVWQVTEKVRDPETVYVVEEIREVTRQVRDEQSQGLFLVERVNKPESPEWQYVAPGGAAGNAPKPR